MSRLQSIIAYLKDKFSENYKQLAHTELGVITGFAEVGLKLLIKEFSYLFFPGEGKGVLKQISNSPWYLMILIPTFGLLISRYINSFFKDKTHTHGIAKVIESILVNRGIIKPVVPIVKAINSAITIGMGGSVGPEGPAAYLGAGLGSGIGQLFRANTQRIRTLVAAGAGAGIAAAFNAPIAGALFAVEIILMEFKFHHFSVIVIATVMATFVSRSLMGDFAEFQSITFTLASGLQFIFFILLGLASGLVSWLFIQSLNWLEKFYRENKFFSSIYGTILSGIVIGAVGLILPYTLGTGYDTIDLAISNKLIWYIAFALVFIKITTTGLTLASGGTGGVFAPAIFVGATLGMTIGTAFYWLFPAYSPPIGAMSIVGVAGLLAGTMHAPFTAIIVVFELTKNQDFILPTMITSIVSVAITKKLVRESIYTIPIEFKNSLIKYRNESNLLDNIFVGDYYKTDFTIIFENSKLSSVVESLIKDKNRYIVVFDLNNRFYGIITIEVIKQILFDEEILKDLVIAGDIASQNNPAVRANQSLKEVLEIVNKYSIDVLPVFSEENRFLGIIDRATVDQVYADELSKMNMSVSLASNVTNTLKENYVYLSNDVILTEIEVPEKFIGKTIKELDIRNQYSVEIIMIKKSNNEQIITNPNYILQKNDKLILTTNNIKYANRIKEL